MKEVELLAAKKLVRASATQVSCSVVSGGGGWRFRVSASTDDFQFLFGNLPSALAPKSVMYGSGAEGIIVQLSSTQGVRVSLASKSVVVCDASARTLDCAEQTIRQSMHRAVLAEYDDKTRYLIIEPLHDGYISSANQRRRLQPSYAPLAVAIVAFAEARTPLVLPEAPEPIAPAPIVPAPTQLLPVQPVVEVPPAIYKPINVKDLKEALEIVNDQLTAARSAGAAVNVRIENGLIKAQVQFVINEEV